MSPPAHVYGVLEGAAPAAPADATTMLVAATSAVIRTTKRRIRRPLLVSPPVAGHAVWCPHRSAVKYAPEQPAGRSQRRLNSQSLLRGIIDWLVNRIKRVRKCCLVAKNTRCIFHSL